MKTLPLKVGDDLSDEYIISRIHEWPLYRDLDVFHKVTGQGGVVRRFKEDAPKHRLRQDKGLYSNHYYNERHNPLLKDTK